MRGKVFVVDGADGAGKQTQSKLLVERLIREGYPAQYEEEPTSNGIGLQIKSDLAKRSEHLDPTTLQILFTADRSQHVHDTIAPGLASGTNFVLDRFWPSTISYADALGAPSEVVESLLQFNSNIFPRLDAVFLLSLPPEVAVKRMQARGRPIDRHESDMRFQIKVGNAYRRLYTRFRNSGQWHWIDANRPVEEISKEIHEVALKLLRDGGSI